MNRSVINYMIAAGVLATGAGVASAPALADPNESGTVTESDSPRPVRPKGRPGAETSDGGQDGDRPCEWARSCRSGSHKRTSGNSDLGMIPLIVAPVLPRPPAVAVKPAVVPVFDLPTIEKLAPPADEGAAVAVEAPAAPVVAWAGQPSPDTPAVRSRPAPVAAPPPPAAPSAARPLSMPVPVPPAAPVQAPAISVELPRLGYPDELRDADFAKVAALALPGLAAIAGMTALGGLFGYRQARAGYVLRTAGAGRFLQ